MAEFRKLKTISVLLRIKRQAEDRSAARFAKAKGDVEALRGRITRLQESLSEQDGLIRRALHESPSPKALSSAVELYRQRTTAVREAIAKKRLELADARRRLAEARMELLEAMARRKALEQLAQQSQSLSQRRQRRLETRELDEAHLARMAMSASGGTEQ